MANAVSYMRNVSKSIKYSAIDSMKKMNPVVTSFYETNQDVFTETYRAIKDIKGTTKDTYSKVIENEVGGLAKTYFRNLMEDAKSGKFYNKDRIEKDYNDASISFGGMDDMDFGIEFDDDNIEFDSSPSSSSSSLDLNDIDHIAEKSTTAVGQIMARTAQYQVEAQRQSTKVLYDQNAAIFGRMHSSMGAINSNVGMIINYMKENTNTHYENSRTFYENTTNAINQTNEILKEMLDLQKKQLGLVEKSFQSNDRVRYGDIFSAEGALDLKEYVKLVKQNINDKSDGTLDMLKTIMDPSTLNILASSPLQGITDAVVKMITPKMVKDAFSEFNKSLSGFFGSLIMKIGDGGDSGFGIMSSLAEILGFKDNLKKGINTGNYNKGVVPFDGVTRKAIIDVIPTYLSKIYSAVSGSKESRYNYERGRFVTVDSLKNELQQIFDQSSNSASTDIKREFDSYSKAFSFKGGKEQQAQFEKDMKLFFDYHFKNAKLYNKKLKARDYGMTSKYSEENLALFQKMWEQLPTSMKMQYASNIMNSRESFNRRMEGYESDSLNPIIALFDGSLSESMSGNKTITATDVVRRGKSKKGKVKKNKKQPSASNIGGIDVDESLLNKIQQERLSEYYDEDNSDSSIFGSITESLFADSKLVKKTNNITKKPASLLSAFLNRVDNHLYAFIFGDDKFDADAENNGMLNAIFHKIQDSFDRFNIWIDQNVLLPFRDKFNREKVKDAAKSFFGMFGVDIESLAIKAKEFLFGDKETGESGLFTDFGKEVKSSFKSIGSYIKQSFVDVGNYFNIFGKKNIKGQAKDTLNRSINSYVRGYMGGTRKKGADQDAEEYTMMEGVINADDQYKRNIGVGSVENAAEGIKRVSKTGVIVASEGELIIPPDRNPFNIARRYRNENKAKSKFLSYINNYGEGGTVTYDRERVQKNIKEALSMKQALNRDDYDELHIGYQIIDQFKELFNALRGTVSDITGKAKDKIGETNFGKNGFSDAIGDVMGHIKEYAPDMVVGSGIGTGVSLLTSAIGGPLLGAASGAAISLIKNSKTVQNWLFGDIKDGERQGGLLSKDLSNNIEKYIPDMAKGATLGTITSIMPFVPGGPVAGMILGSSIGFAKNNEKIQNMLFGEQGLLGKDFPEKVKQRLPKMGAGAILGLVGGPFGVATNVILGSAIGFASDTEAFKKVIFGEKDESTGKREGGIVGALKESVIEPNKQFFGNMFKEFTEWFNTDIKENFTKFVQPVQQDMRNLTRNLYRHLKRKVDGLFDKFMTTALGKRLDNLFGNVNNAFQKVTGFAFGVGKSIISAPFKLAGRYGDTRRTKQIKSGNADLMSAAERLAFRQTDAFKQRSGRFKGRDRYLDLDTTLANMNSDQVVSLLDNLDYARNAKEKVQKDKRQVIKDIKNLQDLKIIDPKMQEVLMAYVKIGNTDKINQIVDNLRPTYTDNKGNIQILDKGKLKESLNKSVERYRKAANAENAIDTTQNEALQTVANVLGIDISKVKSRNLYDYVKAEANFRGGITNERYKPGEARTIEEMIDEKEQARHQQVVDLFTSAIDYLKKIAGEDGSESQTDTFNPFISNHQFVDTDVMDGEYVQVDESGKITIRDRIKGSLNKIKNNKVVQTVSNLFRPMTVQAADANQDGNLPDKKTEFYQGNAITHVKTKDGSYVPDKSDSETVEALKKIQEDRQTQKGILGSLTSMPSKILSFFGKKDGEKEDKKESIFSKLIKTAALGALIAFAPKIFDFFNQNIKPVFTDFVDGFKAGWNDIPEMFDNGAGKIGQIVGDKIHDGLSFVKDYMTGTGQFNGKGFPYLLTEKLIPGALTGFEYIMANVVPKAVEILVGALPAVIKGAIKGLGSLWDSIFNKDDKRDKYNGEDSFTSEIKSINIPTSNSINWKPSNAWKVSNVTIDGTDGGYITGGISYSDNGTNNGKINITPVTSNINTITSNRRFTDNSKINNLQPDAFKFLPKNQQQFTSKSYENVKNNVVYIDGFGDMTIQELLGRDDIIVDIQPDGNGNMVEVTGVDILSFPQTAKKFGINSDIDTIRQEESARQNPGIIGAGKRTVSDTVMNIAARSLIQRKGLGSAGLNLSKKLIKSGLSTNAKALFPTGIGGIITAPGKLMYGTAKTAVGGAIAGTNVISNGAAYLGSKILPTSENIKVKTATNFKEAVDNITGIITKSSKSKASTNNASIIAKYANKEKTNLLKKFIDKVSDILKNFFDNNKLLNFISEKITGTAKAKSVMNAFKEFGKKLISGLKEKITGTAAAKITGKLATKITALLANPIATLVIQAVFDFISGWNNTDINLNISDPTIMQKIVSGLFSVLSGLIWDIIPEDTLIDWIFSLGENIDFFKSSIDNVKDQQSLTEQQKDQYNLEHGTNYTIDEYLEIKNHKVRSTIKNVGKGISEVVGGVGDTVVGAGRAIGKAASSVASNTKDFFSGLFKSENPAEDIRIVTSTKTVQSGNENVINEYSATIDNQNKILATPIAFLAENGKALSEVYSNYLGGIEDIYNKIDSEIQTTVKNANGTDLRNYWKTKSTGNDLSGSITDTFISMQKTMLFPIAFINNTLSKLSKPFQSLVTKVKSNPVVSAASSLINSVLNIFKGSASSSTSSSSSSTTSTTKLNTTTSNTSKSGSSSIKVVEVDETEDGASSYDEPKKKGILGTLWSKITGSGSELESNASVEDPYYGKPVNMLNSSSEMRKMTQEQLFVSQNSNILSNKRFNIKDDTKRQTVADAGCAPAAATMAINLANRSGITSSKQTFSNAINNALKYKVANQGVTADYFIDEFKKKGMSTAFISSGSSISMKNSIINMLRSNKPVVLMGSDSNNKSKKNSPFGPNGHYVVATGISDDGKYIYINDPESKLPNAKYAVDSIMKSVSLGMVPVKKNNKLDSKLSSSKVSKFMKRFRGTSLTGSSNEEKCWNFFISQGFSEAATAGVMGNIYVESHFDPSIKQIGGGPGRGLCQWEESYSGGSGRYNSLVAYANSKGTNWDDLQTQLEFVIKEITDGTMTPFFKLVGGLDKYMKSSDAKQAAKDWLIAYELCGTNYNFDNFDISTRQSKAVEYLQMFTGQGVPGSLGSVTTGSDITSGGIVINDEPAWKKENPSILDLYTVFDDLAKAYGLSSGDSLGTSSTSYTGSVSGSTVSDANKAELQRKLANSFIKSENAIKNYSQSNRYSYQIADDGTITGTSADCSSLIQGVYKKFLDSDPGSWTGAMLQSSNTYTVEKGSGSPGDAPTESKMQLGDLVIYGPNPSGSHVEMYVGDGKTMGHGSAPGPHYASSASVVNGKIQSWHSQNRGLNEVRRWVGFQGAGSGLNNQSRIGNIITKNGKTFRRVFSGRGTGTASNSYNYITSNYSSKSTPRNILSDVFGNDITASNVYDHTLSTGSDVYATVKNTTNNVVTTAEQSNSAQLVGMLKIVVKLLVKMVDNSENMKQIVSLLTQLVQVVSTNNDDGKQTKSDKVASAAVIKANLLNTINNASQSNPDKELIDIINNMEALASM